MESLNHYDNISFPLQIPHEHPWAYASDNKQTENAEEYESKDTMQLTLHVPIVFPDGKHCHNKGKQEHSDSNNSMHKLAHLP
jgi:hypothetical protein